MLNFKFLPLPFLSIQDIVQNRWSILYLLQVLAKDPKVKDQVSLKLPSHFLSMDLCYTQNLLTYTFTCFFCFFLFFYLYIPCYVFIYFFYL